MDRPWFRRTIRRARDLRFDGETSIDQLASIELRKIDLEPWYAAPVARLGTRRCAAAVLVAGVTGVLECLAAVAVLAILYAMFG